MWQVADLANTIRIAFEPVRDRFQPARARVVVASLQNFICWAALLPFGGVLILMLKYLRGYRIEDMAAIRRAFRATWEESNAPLIICANHLTFIDSALIIWALASNIWYLRNYRAFTWNLPAGDVFKKKLRYRLTLYFTKCIFLHRDGTSEHKNEVLSLCRYLLLKGQTVLIFPEGQRSRTGFFEAERLRFGVGKIASSLDECRVLCIYLRGDKQETYSNYPPAGSSFVLKSRLLKPEVRTGSRKQASIDIVRQIGATIRELELEYFAARDRAS